MKKKSICLSLVLISLLGIIGYSYSTTSLSLSNNDYSLGIKIGNSFIWEVTTVNETEMETTFGSNWQDLLGAGESNITGARLEIIITNITTTSVEWILDIDITIWTVGEFLFYDQLTTEIARSPENFDIYDHSSDFFPIPLKDYLLNITTFPLDYSVQDNTVIYSDIWLEPFEVWYIFNEDVGVIEKYQIKNDDGDVIYEYILISMKLGEKEAAISFGYIFIIFIIVGVIYLILMKKRFFTVKQPK